MAETDKSEGKPSEMQLCRGENGNASCAAKPAAIEGLKLSGGGACARAPNLYGE
ncbi:hypothetical protein RSK20926_20730 [Roseobacter sp. SK209-2-6]|nr:hypothetical protein RSK20926_20730 [Roseobacter sp. SK209-2-6]